MIWTKGCLFLLRMMRFSSSFVDSLWWWSESDELFFYGGRKKRVKTPIRGFYSVRQNSSLTTAEIGSLASKAHAKKKKKKLRSAAIFNELEKTCRLRNK
ncbi:uncharacterized protein BYT42DRAFT_98807 [Radiomyces spectabilis]|uniref:uncharacterized protein n=1 Tax=Radiomyces spectabilis TaxID=64574 RepID=UPI00222037EF|nr:uncharacterized protein BYT42DRAFT_98807 [Radiomyces spectabilis]KAI8370684.1 hypothetical protein BYT42DRAFT_98807 [Radiomyces spectabilis]